MPVTFADLCQASTAKPAIRFTYTAPISTDLSAYVINISPITRDAFLTAGNCTVTLDNGDGYFDDFLDVANQLYGTAEIALYFPELPATFLPLFTGYVESVDMGLDTVTMRLRDRLSLCLDTKIGSGESPVDYNGAYSPYTIVYDLLIIQMGLSSLSGPTNPDIDWDSFEAWDAVMDAGDAYAINARFTGHTVGYILKRIAELTNSVFWGNGLGKLCFSPPAATGTGIDFTKDLCIDRNVNIDCNGSVKLITAYYDLNITTDEFLGFYTHMHTGIRAATEIEEDRNIWHTSPPSVMRYVQERLDKYSGGPIRTFTIPMWFVGFLTDISAVETLLNHYADPNDDIDIKITDLSFDLMSYEATLTGQWVW